MLGKVILITRLVSIVLGLILVASMFMASPQNLGPFGITAWFAVLMVVLMGIFTDVLVKLRYPTTREGYLLALRRGFLISMWLVALLALSSLRQLGIRDIILIIILGLLIDFYMRRIEQ